VDALSDALHRVLNDATLCDELAKRGKQRAARFTWPSTARQTTQVYRQAWQQSRSRPSRASVKGQERAH
jgi:hypothetical protein